MKKTMKNLKKKLVCGISLGVLMASMLCSLSGCGGGKDDPSAEAALKQGLNLKDKAREQMSEYNNDFKKADDLMTIEP